MRLIILSLLLSSCANFNPFNPLVSMKPYQGPTSKEVVVQTGKNKTETFNDTVVFLSKILRDSNDAIKIKDEKAGIISAHMIYPCLGDSEFEPRFNVEIGLKEGRAKILVTMTELKNLSPSSRLPASLPLVESEHASKKFPACINGLVTDLTKGISAKKNSDW